MAKWKARTPEQMKRAIKEMQQAINRQVERACILAANEFYDYCLEVLRTAVMLAPVEYGDLRSTAYLTINGTITAYGDVALENPGVDPAQSIYAKIVFPMGYALVQHEHPEFAHPKGGQAFYLEVALAQVTTDFLRRMYEQFGR